MPRKKKEEEEDPKLNKKSKKLRQLKFSQKLKIANWRPLPQKI